LVTGGALKGGVVTGGVVTGGCVVVGGDGWLTGGVSTDGGAAAFSGAEGVLCVAFTAS